MEQKKRIYKILFIGFGSIGKRHILNTLKIFESTDIGVEIDLYRSGRGAPLLGEWDHKINNIYTESEKVPDDYEAIFITNPTSCHYETIKQFQKKGKAFFIEKPVFQSWNINLEELNLDKKKEYYVACPLRYTSVIQYLKKNIDFQDVLVLRAISSSYLPEWRPDTDYRTVYSAHKELGGGVAIDLIHEWDYLTYLSGMPEDVTVVKNTISDLEINSEDIAVYIGQYSNKIVELHLDYFGRSPIRQLQLFTKEDTILCDLIESSICFMKNGKKIRFDEDRNIYQIRELEFFYRMIQGKCENVNTINHACRILKLAEGVIS